SRRRPVRTSSASGSCGVLRRVRMVGAGAVAVDQFAFGGNEIQRHVPVLLVDLGQFLERIGDADQQWFGGAHLFIEEGEAAVVVAAAVAEPVAATVEAEQRDQHQV